VAAWVKVNQVGGYQTFVSEDGDVLSSFFLQLRRGHQPVLVHRSL